ncbi:MAG: FHA domain-containing protein [Eubacterium sp.]
MKNKYYDPFECLNIQNISIKNSVDDNNLSKKTASTKPIKTSGAKRAYLIRIDNDEKIVINKVVFSIGKNDNSNYVIVGNNAISRNHAEIHLKNNTVYIVDKKSTNKTFVNNIAIQPETLIKISDGDKVKFANVEFVLSIE